MSNIIQSDETYDSNYLKKTTSLLNYVGVKEDNTKLVYCTAANLKYAVNSTMHQLDVRCKYDLSLIIYKMYKVCVN